MSHLEECEAWLRGERSTVNWIEGNVNVAQADAAYTQQAYYVVKAFAEGLVDNVTTHQEPTP